MMAKQKINWKIICTGLICITGLELAALYHGIDGTLFTIVIGVIGATIGVTIPTPKIE